MKRCFLLIVSSLLCFFTTSAIFSLEKEPISNYQVLFSPEDHVAEEMIALIAKEKKSIKAAVYCFMHRSIAKALIEAHQRGVQVEVIIDPYSIRSKAAVRKMHDANVPIFVWNPAVPTKQAKNGQVVRKHRRSLMHDKFCVFGNHRVWTGSFNFTLEASNANRENIIILESNEIASRFLKEFEHLKNSGCMSYKEYLSLTMTK